MWWARPVVAAGGIVLAVVPVAAASTWADLALRMVSRPPARAAAGARLSLSVRVENIGRGRAPRSRVTLHLSRDARLGRGDVRLPGGYTAPALAPKRGARQAAVATTTLTTTVPRQTAPGSYRLLACVDTAGRVAESSERNNCAGSALLVLPPAAGGPGSPAVGEGLAAPAPAAPPPPPGTQTVAGQVLYMARDCRAGAPRQEPLAHGTVRLVAGGRQTVVALDAAGGFTAQLPAGEVLAFARTTGAHVTVGPDAEPFAAYEIPLGAVTASGQRFVIGMDAAAGAANIFSVLERGAGVGETASPVALPAVQARWRYAPDLVGWLGDSTGSAYDSDTIFVGGHLDGTRRDEWERFPLLHEYAHHILDHVAPPRAQGEHDFTTVHRDNAGLAWSEGFGNAFAAIAPRDPQLRLACTVRMDLSAAPATARLNATDPLRPMPAAPQEHLAQYNETTIAGATYGAALEIGAGDAQAGLKRLLRALRGFTSRYHPPRDMREVRDALIEDGAIETTAAQTQAIGDAFARQNIAWGISVAPFTQIASGGYVTEVQARVTGPATCHVTFEGDPSHPEDWFFGFRGPLDFTTHDDCHTTQDGEPLDQSSSDGDGQVWWELPYLAGQAHRHDEFTVALRYTCTDFAGPDDCPAAVPSDLWASGMVWVGARPTDEAAQRASGTARVTLQRNTWLDVARFDAAGRCMLLGTGASCGS